MFALRWILMLLVATLPGLALAPAFRRALGGRTGLAALLGISLTPVLVSLAFYALRLAGLGVLPSVVTICVGGVLAGVVGLFGIRDGLPGALRAAVPPLVAALGGLALMVYVLAEPQARANQGHVFMHADLVHAFLAGTLWPEEPILAGLECGYPFFPYPYQAVVAWVLGQTPVLSYVWPNLVGFAVLIGIADRMLVALGVGPRGRVLGGLWLCFGLNPLGYTLHQTLPAGLAELDVWGDYRYSPWMQKYLQASHMPLCFPPLLGVLAVGMLPQNELRTRPAFFVLLALGLGTGLLYPVTFGVAVAAIGSVGAALFWVRRREGLKEALRDPVVLALGGVLISLVLVAYFVLLGTAKERGAIQRSPLSQVGRKTIELFVVAGPMIVMGLWYRRRGWRLTTSQTFVLLGTAAASAFAYLVVWLPSYRNEYKFMYGVGLGLFPFLPLVADGALARRSLGAAAGALAVAGGLLFAPAAHQLYVNTDFDPTRLPVLAQDELTTRAVSDPRFGRAEAFDAIREQTPKDAVLVAGFLEHYAPTYTQRSLLVAPPERKFLEGYNWPLLAQMGTRGYPWSVLKRREEAVLAFFSDTVDPDAIEVFVELGRPAVLLVDLLRYPETAAWLRREGPGEPVYANDRVLVWLIEVSEGSRRTGSSSRSR